MSIKKTVVSLLIMCIVLIQLAVPTFADEFPALGVICGTNVNVRSGAGYEYDVIDQTNEGVVVDVFAKEGSWYRIGLGYGQLGYVYSDYVRIRTQKEEEASRGVRAMGERVVAFAKQYLGTPYVYGGTSASGFDCSGLTYYVYKQLGYTLNRTADGQLANGMAVNKSDLQPGDLVIFKHAGNSTAHHVGIYVGDGMMIHSPQTGDVVKLSNINSGYYNNCYYAARRIVR